jgi:Bifunctional DNA primase/polymerase, N-terminal
MSAATRAATVTAPCSDLAGLVRRGLAVFPLPPGSKAAAPGWHRQCSTDLTMAAGWPAGSNTGVGCRASSIVGLDLDRHAGKPDGVASFACLVGELGAGWPSTFTVATPSGGLHLYFRVPAGLVVPSAAGIWPGVDTRGPGLRLGGYLAGPGSVVGGRRYEIARDEPIAELSAWLAALITRTTSARLRLVTRS